MANTKRTARVEFSCNGRQALKPPLPTHTPHTTTKRKRRAEADKKVKQAEKPPVNKQKRPVNERRGKPGAWLIDRISEKAENESRGKPGAWIINCISEKEAAKEDNNMVGAKRKRNGAPPEVQTATTSVSENAVGNSSRGAEEAAAVANSSSGADIPYCKN